MRTHFVFCLLLIQVCFACKKTDENPKVCMVNKSGHPVHFWAPSYGGHIENFGKTLCGYEIEKGKYFSWRADYPTISPDGLRTGALMTWQGGFVVNEDTNFEFTDQSGTLIYDFRDSIVGNYAFGCKILKVPQNEIIWADTLLGKISKNSFLNQLEIEIDTFYTGTAVFDAYPNAFKFSDGYTGRVYKLGQDEIEIISIGQPLQKTCLGKKI